MADLAARLAALAAVGQQRHLAVPRGIDLTSNDVLGLASHPEVRDALLDALTRDVPTGAGASRLLTGQHPAWVALEDRFARWQDTEASLFHATGFAANTGLLGCLPEPGDRLVSDALNHASLIDGARLSKAQTVVVPHADLDALDDVLRTEPGRTTWVVVESVYSMEGDAPDLVGIAERCQRHGAHLIVDEAHATGLFGRSGQGCIDAAGVREAVFASVHTAGKALGVAGAFVCGSQLLVDWLVNRSRPFVFSTAPPPFLAAGLHAAMDLVQEDADLRARPLTLAQRLRTALGDVDTGMSTTHVVPVVVGSEARAIDLMRHLAALGWDARAIRPPTVPEGTSRVRLVTRAPLSEAQVDQLAHDVLQWPGWGAIDG